MELTANALQTVEANRNVLFTETAIPGNCAILHREGSGLVTLRGLTQQCRARYKINFGGNLAVPEEQTATAISVAVAVSGEPLTSTTMTVTPTDTNSFFNVYGSATVDVPKGCCIQISVENTSAIPINVQNANLIVERTA